MNILIAGSFMELTLDQALQKGIEAHKAGQLQQADQLYTAILQVQPKHPDANHNMGVLAVSFGKVQEALPYFKTALEANSNKAQFWLSYIDALIKLDRLTDAKALFDQAKEKGAKGKSFDTLEKRLSNLVKQPGNYDPPEKLLKQLRSSLGVRNSQDVLSECFLIMAKFPNSPSLHNITGIAFKNLNDVAKAQEYYRKAIELKPGFFKPYNNLGVSLQDQGKLEEAIDVYNKALAIRPECAESYSNMGVALQENGRLEDAIECYNRALSIKPDYVGCFINLNNLEIQLSKPNPEEIQNIHTINNTINKILSTNPKYVIQQAIANFILGKVSLTSEYLENYRTLIQKEFCKTLKPEDYKFCNAYFGFLTSLIKNETTLHHIDYPKIYHIGESHCLSYARSTIWVATKSYIIAPRIIFGAKAFHFATKSENQFKAITKYHLNNIPEGSEVLISIGEIDCRANEGIIKASNKTGRTINKIIDETVEGYVNWFLEDN